MIEPVICRLSASASEQVARIESVCNRPPWPQELFESEFNHSYSYTHGARVGGELVGFLVCHFVLDEVHILNFGIAPKFRRKGIGRMLIRSVLMEFHERSARWATLEVRVSNQEAKGLYNQLGFQQIGTRAGYYTDDGEDALVLQLNLDSLVSKRSDCIPSNEEAK